MTGELYRRGRLLGVDDKIPDCRTGPVGNHAKNDLFLLALLIVVNGVLPKQRHS